MVRGHWTIFLNELAVDCRLLLVLVLVLVLLLLLAVDCRWLFSAAAACCYC
jgi:hypothetical protein